MRRSLIILAAALAASCGLPGDIVGPTDPYHGPPEQPPTRGA